MATVKYWNGSAWVATNIGAEVYTQSSPPATTTVGALWFDTDELPARVEQLLRRSDLYGHERIHEGSRHQSKVSTINEVAAVLATLIEDLKAAGILKT